ncbi:MAG TPA: penicillin-binding transpeptidase domain-containing protein [Vicinamibacteria bacterium]|nr:penicillin-binding transpeptidase domain-containing protein [Vicinamibacteria bacterium]
MLRSMGAANASLALLAVAVPVMAATRSSARPAAIPPVIVPPSASRWDLTVAEAARRSLGRTAGAVVAMDPATGRVITIVNPTYGLFNAYQPCSVFKVVVAIGGLTEGVVTPETIYRCQKGCWSWPGHGPIDLRRALAVSCNPYFEWIGEQIGYAKVQHYAKLLGLGEASGINLTGETKGRLPATVSPAAVGHLSSHAEGITTSAVQLAVLLSATINGGIVWQPQVGPAQDFTPKERWRLPAGTRLDGLADGFMAAVNEGSALPAFDPEVVVAGKTGSCSRLGWFASYGPAEEPRIVLVVFVRRGNGHTASAIAGRIYQELYKPQPAAPVTTAAGGQP